MLELAFFLIPSFFLYLGYVKKINRQVYISSQWLFLCVFVAYSVGIFYVYFFLSDIFNLTIHFRGIEEFTTSIENLKFSELAFIFILSYILGHSLNWKIFKKIDLFIRSETSSQFYKLIEKSEGSAIILFLNNGDVHIGVPVFTEYRTKGVFCFHLDMYFSGHKKDGIVNYHTNYMEVPKPLPRLFYVQQINSVGEFNAEQFVYFLTKKSEEERTKTENKILERIKNTHRGL